MAGNSQHRTGHKKVIPLKNAVLWVLLILFQQSGVDLILLCQVEKL